MDVNQAKDIVIKAGKELVKRGLIARTWGNVSQRVDENTMVITPSGKDYLSLERDDIVVVDIESLKYNSPIKPSSEKGVHASCYINKKVNFVIHTHQEYASVVSTCNIDFIQADAKYNLLKGMVYCAPYGLPSTKKLCSNITKVLKEADGCCIIMKNHGALCFGEDFEQTFDAANQLEDACIEYLENRYSEAFNNEKFVLKNLLRYVLPDNMESVNSFEPKELKAEMSDDMIINTSPIVVAMSYLNIKLKPMVDDFAQIVGTKMQTVLNNTKAVNAALEKADAVFVSGCGAVCHGLDAEAVSMIVEKNCMAYMWALVHGKAVPINAFESRLMRTIYKMKYSKQKSQ